jgi:chromosomal replication initiation ATPase DnaA
MPQMTFDMDFEPDYSPSRFIVSDSNRAAYNMIIQYPHWKENTLLLVGEPGSGKTHLAHIWLEHSAGEWFDVEEMHALPKKPVVVDHIEKIENEEGLFHLLNHAKNDHVPMLLLSDVPASQLPFSLPDLTSRLKALPVVQIEPADDRLLQDVMLKQFADRQLAIESDVMSYLIPRMDRSLAAVSQMVAKIDQASLEAGRTITVPFLSKLLSE